MDDFERELRATFLDEARQLLAENEKFFLELEVSGGRQEVIEAIFRLVHSFKGSAGAAGFAEVSSFAHHLESLLLKVKSGELAMSAKVVDVLLQCNDQLSQMIAGLSEDGHAHFDCGPLVAVIESLDKPSSEGDGSPG